MHVDPHTDGTASLDVAFALTTGELVKPDDLERSSGSSWRRAKGVHRPPPISAIGTFEGLVPRDDVVEA